MVHQKYVLKTAILIAVIVFADRVRADDVQRLPYNDYDQEFVFTEAAFQQCHSSTITDTPAGLVAAWFAGTKEGADDVGIWVSRHQGEWTDPVEVVNGIQPSGKRYPCWNPVLYQVPHGPLMLFYKVGDHPSRWWGELMLSYDGGRVWTPSRRLPEGILGPINNKPVLLSNGALLSGSSTEHDGWRVHFEMTRDWGTNWKRIGPVADTAQFDAIQPAILIHANGSLQALCRSRGGHITTCWSQDAGETWGARCRDTLRWSASARLQPHAARRGFSI